MAELTQAELANELGFWPAAVRGWAWTWQRCSRYEYRKCLTHFTNPGHLVPRGPYPNDILTLGGNRWLAGTGEILTTEFGSPVDLQPNTLAFWEAAAVRGTGKTLSELIV